MRDMPEKEDTYTVVVVDLKGSTEAGEELPHRSFVDFSLWLRKTIEDTLEEASIIRAVKKQFTGDGMIILFKPERGRDILIWCLTVRDKWKRESRHFLNRHQPVHIGIHQGLITLTGREIIGHAIALATKLARIAEDSVALPYGLRATFDLNFFQFIEKTVEREKEVTCIVTGRKPKELEKKAEEEEDADSYLSLAFEAYLSGNLKEAEEYCRNALRMDPNLLRARNNLGILLQKQERYEEAEKEYREALRIDPNLAPPSYNLGLLLILKGDVKSGAGLLKKAIELRPEIWEFAKTDPDLIPFRDIPEIKKLLEEPRG